MCLVREFFVIGVGVRFAIPIQICFDHRARHNAIFAAGDQEQRRPRVVMKSDGAWRVRTKVRKRNLPQNAIRSRNDVTLEAPSIAAFERYAVPAPDRFLRQVALANFSPDAPSTVRFHNDSRAPLLLVAGGKDRVVPSSMVKANFDSYRESKAETDYKEYPDQSHFTLLHETKIADYVLGWALCRANGSKLTAFSNQKTDAWSVQLSA